MTVGQKCVHSSVERGNKPSRSKKNTNSNKEKKSINNGDGDVHTLTNSKPKKMAKQTFRFQWSTCPVSLEEEKRLASVLIRKGEFGPLDADRSGYIRQLTSDNAFDQALSLRAALLQQKAMYGHLALQSHAKQITRLYKKEGCTVVELSKRFDSPPMNVFRLLLAEMKWSKQKIKSACNNPDGPLFQSRERTEFHAAEAADTVSNFNQDECRTRADRFECFLCEWFEQRGVRLRRESEIVKEQVAKHGRAVCTPDILFLDHVEINGTTVSWIDAKNFYGSGTAAFQKKSTRKQIEKYIREWGHGAIVYRYSFCKNLSIPKCTMLDVTSLDLNTLQVTH